MKQTKNNLNTHTGALEHLVNHLDLLDLSRMNISWVLKEPRIYIPNSCDQEKACDLIVGYNAFRDADLIELKHSYEHIDKAIQQLKCTEEYFLKEIGYKLNHKYVVFYPFFNYEIIE
jgi:hypothetical protein